MPDQRVVLVLEYTKRRGKKGVQNEIIQEFINSLVCAVPEKNQILRIFKKNISLNFDEFLEHNRKNIF